MDHKNGQRVPVQIGSQVIDHFVVTIRKNCNRLGKPGKQVHLSTVISKRNTLKGLNVSEYDLKGVKGKICTIREVIILPFMTHGNRHYELDDTFKNHECSC